MENSLPFLDPKDASEGVKTFSEGVRLFSNQTPVFLFKCHHLKAYYAGQVGVSCSFQFVHLNKLMYFPSTLFIYDQSCHSHNHYFCESV